MNRQKIIGVLLLMLELSLLTLHLGYCLKTLNIAISAAIVLPDPVGAPRSTLLSV